MDALRRHLGRRLLFALVATALVAPASANAAFAKLDAGKVTFTTISGEANDLTATHGAGGVVQLRDAGHWGPFPIMIGGSGGCSGIGGLATCTGVTSTSINTGDGNDKVMARNGGADTIACGSGTDSVVADPGDSVAADCEFVDRGSAEATPPPPSDGSSPQDPEAGGTSDPETPPRGVDAAAASPYVNFAPPVIPPQTVSVSPAGVAAVRVSCPVDAGACKGTVKLVLVGSKSAKGRIVAARRTKRVRSVTLGRAHFTAKAGQKPVVRIRLNRRGRRRILRTRHTRCRIVVTTRGADGKVVTTTRNVTIRARRGANRSTKTR